jgi:60kDa lysophospholipase
MSKVFDNEIITGLKKSGLKARVGYGESKILIIYTGGTIGMVQSSKGYIPATNQFAEALKKNPAFHDSNEHEIRLKGPNYSESNFITPKSFYNKRIVYELLELAPLIDSSSMRIKNWIEIAEVIEKFYYDYDGFLILHGTDTMAYTASILSFILENLQKPVILTGSQIPYFEVRNDASKNLLDALTIAGHFLIPEVCLYFNNKLLRGNRATKIDNSSFNSFSSPNCEYLVKSGISFKVNWDNIRRPKPESRFNVQKVLEENISIIYFFPIITLETIKASIQDSTKAVVILSYGAGNVPSNRPEFISELKSASDRGIILLNITQCIIGGASDEYECGKVLTEAGVVLGGDMTSECAVTKLSYLLGKYPGQPDVIKKLLGSDLRGEITCQDEPGVFSNAFEQILKEIGSKLELHTQMQRLEVFNKCIVMIAHTAALEGQIETLKSLSRENISMDTKDSDNRSLLHIACKIGNLSLVEYLISQNVAINPIDSSGATPLLVSIQQGHIDISEILIQKGGEIRGNEDYLNFILSEAAATGNLNKLKLLTKAGVNPNLKDFYRRNIGHIAVVNRQAEVLEFIKNSTNLNWEARDISGDTPLTLAEKLGFGYLDSL